MDVPLGSSPLEFQDDYFASNISSDDNLELANDDDNNSVDIRYRPELHKTASISSLSMVSVRNSKNDKGIMFNNLRTMPSSSINFDNAFVNKLEAPIEEHEYEHSISQADDPLSTSTSPNLTPMISRENTDALCFDDSIDQRKRFPYEFDYELETADECEDKAEFFGRKQHFFILSSAGKPIYSLHGSNELFIVYSGIIQTIVSFFKYSNSGTEIIKMIESRDVNTGDPIKFAFLDRSPIILMTVIKSEESTQIELEQQLDFIYSFLISALSKPYIDKIFNKYPNFDLRNLLGKTDILTLDSICEDLANNLNISQILGGLQCLRMHFSSRTKLERKLLNCKTQNILYGLIVGPHEKLISIIRPKRHTLHSSDLMILFEMIYNTSTFKAKDEHGAMKFISNETFWVPICLPKFNCNGHLYTLIQFHQLNDERLFKLHGIENNNYEYLDEDCTKIGIILMSPYKDSFNELRNISTSISREILFDSRVYKGIWNSLVGNGRLVVENILTTKQKVGNEASLRHSPFTSLMNSIVLNNNTVNKFEGINNKEIIHFTVKNKRFVQCIFPESQEFEIKHPHVKRNLLTVYKYLRRRLQVVTSDFNVYDSENSNKDIDFSTENDAFTNNFQNNIIYETWVSKTGKNTSHNIDSDKGEKLIGFGCKIGVYEIYIISRGDMGETKMLDYGLRILRWCRSQERRIFIY